MNRFLSIGLHKLKLSYTESGLARYNVYMPSNSEFSFVNFTKGFNLGKDDLKLRYFISIYKFILRLNQENNLIYFISIYILRLNQ